MTDATTEAIVKVYSAAPIITEVNRLGDRDVAHNRARFYRWLAAEQAAARRAGMEEAREIARNVYATSQAAVIQRKRTVAAIIAAIDRPNGEPDV
jgi:hypothetical protein